MRFQLLQLAVLGGLALEAAATPFRPMVYGLHEKGGHHWGRGWEQKHRLPRDAKLPMRIGLQQSNEDAGREALADISNPASRNYGKHWTAEEVRQHFAPSRETVETVVQWLTDAGIDIDRISQSFNKQWIQLDVSAAEAESLLQAEFHVYEHTSSGTHDVAATHYHVPHHVASHIDYVTPGTRLRPDPKRVELARRRADGAALHKRYEAMYRSFKLLPELPALNASSCATYVTNQCIQTQYRVPQASKAAPGNELGIFEALNDHYSTADLDDFWANLYPRIPPGTYPIERLIDGAIGAAETPNDVNVFIGLESDLDFQAAWPLIYPQKTVLFQVDDNLVEDSYAEDPNTPYKGFFNNFYDAIDGSYCTFSAFGETGNCVRPECLDPAYPNPDPKGYQGQLQCGAYKPTNVISISYGGGEASVPPSYFRRQCAEIMKLSLQGVTVVQASGDYGVGSYPGDAGLEDGCSGPQGNVFYPTYQCPYVLSVGSTELDATSNSTLPGCRLKEVATARVSSGGGFSNYFDTPDYQKAAVAGYLASAPLPYKGYTNTGDDTYANNFTNLTPPDGIFRLGGRGYPDVAAVGDRFIVRYGGDWYTVGGTSLAAPIWAALLNRVNEERLAAGKSTVGFVHPVLYGNVGIFTDITEGSNPGCGSDGFPAAKGWDPVTGLGSPDYRSLLAVFMALP